MLGRMFGSGSKSELTKPNDNGDYLIEHDVTPEAFAAILKFYKEGKIKCPPTVAVSELHDACRYFMIPFTHTSVQCEDLGKFLHELSNTGAAAQFETFMLRSLLPAMARCAELGERSCHIVVLSETDTVEWDEDLPPTLGEQFAKGEAAERRCLMARRGRARPCLRPATGRIPVRPPCSPALLAMPPSRRSGARLVAVALLVLLREQEYCKKALEGEGPQTHQNWH